MSRSLASTSLTTRSPMVMVPAVGSSSPAIMRSAVDFPHPDGPSNTSKSSSATSRERSSTAVTPSNRFDTWSSATRPIVAPFRPCRGQAAESSFFGGRQNVRRNSAAPPMPTAAVTISAFFGSNGNAKSKASSSDHLPGLSAPRVIDTTATVATYSYPSLALVRKKPFLRWFVIRATTMSAHTPPYATGVRKPATSMNGIAISVRVTAHAWSGPGFRPRLSNQFAIPGPDWIAFTCRHPWAKIMIPIHTRASSRAKFAASLPRYMDVLPLGRSSGPRGRTLPRDVPQPRHQSGAGEHAHRPFLLHVDHQGLAGLTTHHEAHHAVVARRRPAHHALVTINRDHRRTISQGYDGYSAVRPVLISAT